MFDPNTFATMTITEANATEYTPIPEDEYQAVVDEIAARVTTTGKPILDVTWKLDAPQTPDADGKKIRQSVFLDVSGSGDLLSGKGANIQLGRLREAVKQNQTGKAWTPSMLIGCIAHILVKHRLEEASGKIYADVKGVTAL